MVCGNNKILTIHKHKASENTNGLIRQYISKGKDIDDLSDEEVAVIIEKINNQPRKCLGLKTPNQR